MTRASAANNEHSPLKESTRSWLPLSFRINWKILVLSFVSASSFWLLNALNKRYTTQLAIPLRLEYESEGLVTVRSAPSRLRLNLTGVGWDLVGRSDWLGAGSPLILSLAEPTAVKNFSKKALLSGFSEQLRPLRLNYIVEDSLPIDIQPLISRRIAVRVDSLSLPLCKECRVYSPISLSTDSITLTGAEEYVSAYPSFHTLQFDSGQLVDEAFEQETLAIMLPYEEVMKADPSEVEVSFLVGRYLQREILVPVERLHFPRRSPYEAILSDTLVKLVYTVRSDLDDDVKPQHFTVVADYRQRDRRARTLRPQVIHAPLEAIEVRMLRTELSLRYARRR